MAAEHDIRPHRDTYGNFMKLLQRSTVGIAVVLVLMLVFLV